MIKQVDLDRLKFLTDCAPELLNGKIDSVELQIVEEMEIHDYKLLPPQKEVLAIWVSILEDQKVSPGRLSNMVESISVTMADGTMGYMNELEIFDHSYKPDGSSSLLPLDRLVVGIYRNELRLQTARRGFGIFKSKYIAIFNVITGERFGRLL